MLLYYPWSHRVELALDEVLLPGDGQEHEALGEEP